MTEKKHIPALLVVFMFFLASCASTGNTASPQKDGSSMKNAIPVSGIPEEYAYVRKVCEDCLLLGQALAFDEKQNPYDILTLKKPDGKEVSYYFDISKFYGKW